MIKPMLCQTGTEDDLNRPNFVAEPKFDGTRCIAIKRKGCVELWNRHGINYTIRIPEVVEGVMGIEGEFILDGELVVFRDGKEDFTACQRRCSTHIVDPYLKQIFPVCYMVFDILELDGRSLRNEPYLKRKEILMQKIAPSESVRPVNFETDKKGAWEAVVREEKEGLILKEVDSVYLEDFRSWSWLKIKNFRSEVCDVVGYTKGKGSRSGTFGALVLSKDGKYRGCVGSGFSGVELVELSKILKSAPVINKPFPESIVGEDYTAIDTKIKVMVKYYQVSASGVLRHPVYVKIV